MQAPGSATPEQIELSNAIDKGLVEILKDGITALDCEGKVVKLSPPAAYFKVAVDRVSKLGVGPAINEGSEADRLRKELAASGKLGRGVVGRIGQPLPPVSTGEDAATA